MASQKLEEGRAELTRLLDVARLDEQQRRDKAEEVQRQRVEWDVLGQSLHEVQEQLKEWEQKHALTVER